MSIMELRIGAKRIVVVLMKKPEKIGREISEMNRNSVIDISRGLCMIMMILTHLFNWWGNAYPWFSEWVGPFFLVFFFFSSGLCTKLTDRKRMVHRKFKKLVIPYVFLTVVYLWYASFSVRKWYIGENVFETLKMDAASLIYALPSSVNNDILFHTTTIGIGPAWFLNCLFVSTIFFLLFTKLPRWLDLFVLGCLVIVSSETQRMIALPCNVQDAVIGAFFILLGFRGKDFVFSYLQRQNEHKFEKNLAYLMGYVLIYFCVKKWLPYQWFDLGSNIYNVYNVLSLISSLLGFCILFQLAIIIEKTYVFLEFFRRYGKDSMYILLLHHADILMLRDWTQRSFEFAFATVAGYGFMVYLYDRIRFVIETKSMQKAEHS